MIYITLRHYMKAFHGDGFSMGLLLFPVSTRAVTFGAFDYSEHKSKIA